MQYYYLKKAGLIERYRYNDVKKKKKEQAYSLLKEGLTCKEVAKKLHLKLNSVRVYRSYLTRKGVLYRISKVPKSK